MNSRSVSMRGGPCVFRAEDGYFRRVVRGREDGAAGIALVVPNILLDLQNGADVVKVDQPVGNDQDQHLELTRTLARKFNRKFDEVFVEPKPLHTPLPRVMSLDDPSRKMSKSRPEGCLFVDDEPEVIEKKIRRAVTDSGNEVKRGQDKPALNNLLSIYSNLSGKSIKEVEVEFSGRGYADFKKSMAEVVSKYFENFRNTKAKLMNKPSTLTKILEEGSAKASKLADKKLAEAKSAMGLGL